MGENYLSQALEIISDWVIVLDGRRVVFANSGILDALQMSPEEAIGKEIEALLPPGTCKGLYHLLDRLEAGDGGPEEVEVDCGGLILGPTIYQVRGDRWRGHSILSINGTARPPEEPSDRLLELEDRLSAFLALTATAGIGVAVFEVTSDNDLIIKSANEHLLAIMGRSEEEVLGKSPLKFVHPDDLEIIKRDVTTLLEVGSSPGPYQVRIIDDLGEIIYLKISESMLTTGGERLGIGFVQDITTTQEALDQQNRMAQAIERVEETVVLADGKGQIFYANPAALRNSGYTLEELLGRPISIFHAPESVGPIASQEMKSFFKKGWWRGDLLACTKDGRRYPVEVIASMVMNARGEPDMIVVVSRKIGDRQRFEAQLLMARNRWGRVLDYYSDLLRPTLERAITTLEAQASEGEGADQGELPDVVEDLRHVLEAADQGLSQLPELEEFGDLEPLDLTSTLRELIPGIGARLRRKGLEVSVSGGAMAEGVEVMANNMLFELLASIIEVIVDLSGRKRLGLDLALRTLNPSDLPTLEAKEVQEREVPIFAEISIQGPGLLVPEDLRSVLLQREIPTLGRVRPEIAYAIALSGLLAFLFRGNIYIEDRDPEDPGEGARLVIILPLAGSETAPSRTPFQVF